MKYLILLILCTTLPIWGCKKNCTEINNCDLEPDPGPCKAFIRKYYYDKGDKICKEFIWGGCNGVVPFETIEECEKQCECKL